CRSYEPQVKNFLNEVQQGASKILLDMKENEVGFGGDKKLSVPPQKSFFSYVTMGSVEDGSNTDWCDATHYCNDGYHCCSVYWCCPNGYACAGTLCKKV
uniref:Granulins domain-containing protein n=1 Tax=Acrobeloides nanus TaxID=290746 RepID=A0A914E534_9BILA